MLFDAMEQIQVGDRVMSAIGSLGTIVLYSPPYFFKNDDPNYWSGWDGGDIKIDWDNGRSSHFPMFDDGFCTMDVVEYLGRVMIVGF